MSPWFRRKPPSEERPQLVNPEPERERRRAYRQKGEIRAQLVGQVGRPTDVTVLNLSPTGLAFAGPERVQANQDVCIRFTTPADRPVVYTASVRARSQWSSASSRKGEPWSCGATFQPMTLTQHLHLIRFFLEHFGLHFAGAGDKRRQVRLGFNKPVQVVVRIESTRKMIEGEVKNISVDGIGFVCAERIEPSTRLTVSLRAGSRESIPLRGIVVHMRKVADGRFQIGVLTNLTNDADRAMLTEILVSAGRKVFDERESEPFREEMVTGKRSANDATDEDDGVLRPATGDSDKKPAPAPMHRVIEGWRPPWEREGPPDSVHEHAEAEVARSPQTTASVQESPRGSENLPAAPRDTPGLPPAGPVAAADGIDEGTDEDDDEPFSWGGLPAPPPAVHRAPEQDEEDPLEAWARSVNLSPALGTDEETSATWRAPLDTPRETTPGEDRGAPARPVRANPPAPGTTGYEWPTLQRLGPLVPPSRAEQASARPRGRTPEPSPIPRAPDDVPPTMSLGPLEPPPTIHLGPLVPSSGTAPRSTPLRSRGTRPPDPRPAAEVPTRSWAPPPTHGEPEAGNDEDPPTVQLGPLVPQKTDEPPTSPRRPSGEPAAPGESRRPARPWTPARAPAAPSTPAERADSLGGGGGGPSTRKEGPQSALPWRRASDPPPAAEPPAPTKRGSAFRPWNLTSGSSGPPAEEHEASPGGADDAFQEWKPGGSAAEPPRSSNEAPAAPPASTFRPWRPGGGGSRSS